jgi:hypothetical protein
MREQRELVDWEKGPIEVPMDPDIYVEWEGLVCPYCTEQHSGVSSTVDKPVVIGTIVTIDMYCKLVPEHKWYERYMLVGYSKR